MRLKYDVEAALTAARSGKRLVEGLRSLAQGVREILQHGRILIDSVERVFESVDAEADASAPATVTAIDTAAARAEMKKRGIYTEPKS